jgi:hypothetical protein
MKASRHARRMLIVATLACSMGFTDRAHAAVDSFFDILTALTDDGEFNHHQVADTIPTEIVAMSLVNGPTNPPTIPDRADGLFEIDSFFDVTYELNGADPPPPVTVLTKMTFGFDDPLLAEWGDDETKSFDTEMISMSLTGDLSLVTGRGTNGHVTVLKIALPDGDDIFRVDSFFDVFFEIDDPEDDGDRTIEVPVHLRMPTADLLVTSDVPEPTTLAIWATLGGLGLIAARRRRKVP